MKYIAMNHFRVAAGRGGEFEGRWRDRTSYLDTVAGFIQFNLVRGKDEEDGTHRYASHVIWESRQTFLDWTHSDSFRKAHASRESSPGLILDHPRFQGWETVEL